MKGYTARPSSCASCDEDLPVPRPVKQKWCPECSAREQAVAARERARTWLGANRDRAAATKGEYRKQHRSRLASSQREYRRANPDIAKDWKRAHPERVREHNHRAYLNRVDEVTAHAALRRARKAGAFVEHVSRRRVWDLHSGTCGICEAPVSFESMHIDHIIPISRGGAHSYANTQPAHAACNLRKGARLPTDPIEDNWP